jgi:hypothetical protein
VYLGATAVTGDGRAAASEGDCGARGARRRRAPVAAAVAHPVGEHAHEVWRRPALHLALDQTAKSAQNLGDAVCHGEDGREHRDGRCDLGSEIGVDVVDEFHAAVVDVLSPAAAAFEELGQFEISALEGFRSVSMKRRGFVFVFKVGVACISMLGRSILGFLKFGAFVGCYIHFRIFCIIFCRNTIRQILCAVLDCHFRVFIAQILINWL